MIAQDSLLQLVSNLQEQLSGLRERVNSCCEASSFKYGSESEPDGLTKSKVFGEYVVLNTDPNPFSSNIELSFVIPETAENVEVIISDINGTLINKFSIQDRGKGSVIFHGSEVQSGIYLCSIIANGSVLITKKMVKVN